MSNSDDARDGKIGANASLLNSLRSEDADFIAIRHDLHAHPETAYEEHRTASIIAKALASYGLEVTTGVGVTGVVGTLRSGVGDRAIGLRADMDALDMQEANGFAHKSVHPGKMHACGHDGHVAMLLAAASHLAKAPTFDGTVHFVFQPAEEGRAGAQRMIDDGLFERFPMEAIYGMHNIPGIPIGHFAAAPGPMMAGADRFDIIITGEGGHGAMPHLASDPVVATGGLIQALQTIVSRNTDPMQSAVVSIATVSGGSAFNVIPDQVELSGTVRFFDKAVQELVETRMIAMATHIAAANGCRAEVRYTKLFPATVNWADQTRLAVDVMAGLFGDDKVDRRPIPLMASEDFAFMLEAKPGCYVWAGNGDGVGGCSVHNPHYDFNDELIALGAAYWVRLAETALPIS